MGAEIERVLGMGCDYVGGVGGIFEVSLDGRVVYSNHNAGGIPDAAVVIDAIRASRL